MARGNVAAVVKGIEDGEQMCITHDIRRMMFVVDFRNVYSVEYYS